MLTICMWPRVDCLRPLFYDPVVYTPLVTGNMEESLTHRIWNNHQLHDYGMYIRQTIHYDYFDFFQDTGTQLRLFENSVIFVIDYD